jgi:GNAT superfamily N-acetyltransferase
LRPTQSELKVDIIVAINIRDPLKIDREKLLALAESTNIFSLGEVESLLGSTLDNFDSGKLAPYHYIKVLDEIERRNPLGWMFYARFDEQKTIWDLWWIGVAPELQGKGYGDQLLSFAEKHIKTLNGKVLRIETSDGPKLEKTRRFYLNRGYRETGRAADFYGPGEGKIIFGKNLN